MKTSFQAMFDGGVKVGQLRTRLALEGFAQEGPRVAAVELFKAVGQSREGSGAPASEPAPPPLGRGGAHQGASW